MRQSLSLSPPQPTRSRARRGTDAIVARDLRKRFGRTHALDGLDLTVARGEIHGFLGPNGAGKSTTIRAILGQLRLDGGTLTVFGADPRADVVAVHRRLAYVPGDTALWGGLSGGECIDLLGRFHGGQNRARRDELVERFELDPSKRARTYSKGNRQKVALIAALALDVDLLLLDEPTSGLDPLMESVFQSVVRERAEAGATVLLSSHILDEVEALCDRVTIIKRGVTVSTGTLDELRHSTLTTVRATTPAPIPGVEGMPGVSDVHRSVDDDGAHVSLRVTSGGLADLVGIVAGAQPSALVVTPPSLDELFLEHYEDVPA